MIGWELFLGELLFFAALFPVWRGVRKRGSLQWAFPAATAGAGIALACLWAGSKVPNEVGDKPILGDKTAVRKPQEIARDGFVSSRACRSCHPEQYATWHHSFHRTMTQSATPETVLGRFEGQVLTSRGQSVRLEKRGDEFWVRMPDTDWLADRVFQEGRQLTDIRHAPQVERRIVMTTGSHHYQAYWVPGRYGNEVRQLPWVWHIGEQRWLPKVDSFLQPPDDEPKIVLWNQNCIACHATGGVPGLHERTQQLFSRVAEFGIACEACHGPGEEHVRHHQNPVARYRQHVRGGPDPTIVNPARLSAAAGSQVCGQCHVYSAPKNESEWWHFGHTRSYKPGDELTDTRQLLEFQTPDTDSAADEFSEFLGGRDSLFWPDGTMRVGGREYHGLEMSPCYQHVKGKQRLSCLSCHSMHEYASRDDQLTRDVGTGNTACTQCHGEKRFTVAIETHTHHPAGTSGSRCYACHMPHTTYALFKGIRSHRIDSPSLATNVKHGRPNACNLCHLDRSLGWTGERLADWYGIESPKLEDDERTIAAAALWSLKGDAVQRALTAWEMGRAETQAVTGTDWQAPFIAELLTDRYAAVRFIAGRTARTLPGLADFEYDYIGPPEERERVAEYVRAQWQEGTKDRSATNAGRRRFLQDDEGRVLRNEFQRLLDERDDRPVSISE